MKKSTATEHEIALALGRGPVRLFRNNIGAAWLGRERRLEDGSIIILDPTRVVYGLCPGSSDRIGWKSVTVTPDMVGKKVAVFVALEIKTGAGRLTENQTNFITAVNASGGIAGVARNVEDGRKLLGV